MTQEIENKIQMLKNCLYKGSKEVTDLDKVNMQKCLFALLRECIKERYYEVEVGSYFLSIHPDNLAVKYETDETIVELSNEDVYYESTRELEVRYFAMEDRIVYNLDIPTIEVTGMVTNVEGVCEESYQIELFTDEEDNIKNYLDIEMVPGFRYSDQDIETDTSVILTRSIRKDMPRLDVLHLFKEGMVFPVRYDHINNQYLKENPIVRVYNTNNYSAYLPALEDKKELVSLLYSSIVSFYGSIINNQ